MKIVSCISIGIITLSLAACSTGNREKSSSADVSKARLRSSEKPKLKFHADMETSSSAVHGTPVLDALKDNKLEANSTKTIGQAFDSYTFVKKKEWRETPAQNGVYYIDYIGWLDVSPISSAALREGVVKRTLEIKFAIHEDGYTYIAMARRIEIKSDGMEHVTIIDPADLSKIVAAIYENREITF